MRKSFCIILPLMLLLLSACGDHQESTESTNQQVSASQQDTEELAASKLPKNLYIDFSFNEIQSPDTVSCYTASSLEPDTDLTCSRLLRGQITDIAYYADGPQYQTTGEDFTEYLTIFDGGKSLNMDSGVNGGLNYTYQKSGVNLSTKLSFVIMADYGHESLEAQTFGLFKSAYSSQTDLSFLPYAQAAEEVMELLECVGISEAEITESYSLDAETMSEQYQTYCNAVSDLEIQDQAYSYSQEDEAYLFLCRQLIDGIPVTAYSWNTYGDAFSAAGGYMPGAAIEILYSSDGIVDVYMQDLYGDFAAGASYEIYPADQAYEQVIQYYSELLLEEETHILSMELNYVAIPDDGQFSLVPAWMFCVKQETGKYKYYVIDATTGEKIST